MNRRRAAAAVAALLLSVLSVACGPGTLQPAPLDTRNEACSKCRMPVSEARFSSQLVAPGELPRFFDDLVCLSNFLKAGQAPAGATTFVADHRTKSWVPAEKALYTRVPGLETPMGSHIVAHADAGSRDQDPLARGGTPVALNELFGPGGPPSGAPK